TRRFRSGTLARRPPLLQAGKRPALAPLRRPHPRLARSSDAVFHRAIQTVPGRAATDARGRQEIGLLTTETPLGCERGIPRTARANERCFLNELLRKAKAPRCVG